MFLLTLILRPSSSLADSTGAGSGIPESPKSGHRLRRFVALTAVAVDSALGATRGLTILACRRSLVF